MVMGDRIGPHELVMQLHKILSTAKKYSKELVFHLVYRGLSNIEDCLWFLWVMQKMMWR